MAAENEVRSPEMEAAELKSELDRLRAENEQLKESLTETTGPGRWRWPVASVLLIVALLVFGLAVPAMWLNRTVMDTDRWVETVAPLAADPAIQNYVAQASSEAIIERLNVEKLASDLLPDELDILAAPIAAQVDTLVTKLAVQVVQSDQFETIWIEMNRRGHQAFIAAVTGYEGEKGLSVNQGVLALDSTPIVEGIQEGFESTALKSISQYVPWNSLQKEIVVYESPALAQATTAINTLNSAALVLPFVALALIAAAVWAAPDRRKAWLWVGMGIVFVTLLPLQVVFFAQSSFVSAAYSMGGIDSAAANAFYDIVFRFFVNAERTAVALGLVITLAAFLAGPARFAVKFRGAMDKGLSGFGSAWDFGAFGVFVAAHKPELRIVGVVIAIIWLITLNAVSPRAIIGLAVIVGLWILLVEFFGRGTPQSADALPEDAPPAEEIEASVETPTEQS